MTTSKLIRVQPNLAVDFTISEVAQGTLATVRIIGLSHDCKHRTIHGTSIDELPEAAICAAFGNAYDGIDTEAVESDKNILVVVKDVTELAECLALAYGIPLGGTPITIPF